MVQDQKVFLLKKRINVGEDMKGVVLVMNNWREIIKAKGKLKNVPTMRTNLKKPPTKPEKKDCNTRLKAYGEYLSNRSSIISEVKVGVDFAPAVNKKFGSTREADEDDDGYERYTERIISNVESVPEEVACKALEYLEEDHHDDIVYRTIKDNSGQNWTIGWRVEDEFDDDFAQEDLFFEDVAVMLVVYPSNKYRGADNLPYPIMLSHRIILWNEDYTDKVKREMLNRIDWRGQA